MAQIRTVRVGWALDVGLGKPRMLRKRSMERRGRSSSLTRLVPGEECL